MVIPGSKSKRRKVAVANEATAHLVAVLGVAALLVARPRVVMTMTTMSRKVGLTSNGVQVYMRTLSIWRCSKKCEGGHPRRRMEMIGLRISSRSSSSRNEQNRRAKRTPVAKGSKVAAAVWDTLLSKKIKWRRRITPVLCLKYVCRLNDNNDNTRLRHQTPTNLTKRHPLVELLALAAAAAAALDLKLGPH
jgi:hypothetical protein